MLVDPEPTGGADPFDEHEPRLGKAFEMVRHRGLADIHLLDDLPDLHRTAFQRQQVEDADAGGVGQTGEPLRVCLSL